MAMVAKIPERGNHLAISPVMLGQVAQVANDFLHAIGVVAQDVAMLLEFQCEADGAFAMHGDHRVGEVLGGMEEIHDLIARVAIRQGAQEGPIVWVLILP